MEVSPVVSRAQSLRGSPSKLGIQSAPGKGQPLRHGSREGVAGGDDVRGDVRRQGGQDEAAQREQRAETCRGSNTTMRAEPPSQICKGLHGLSFHPA